MRKKPASDAVGSLAISHTNAVVSVSIRHCAERGSLDCDVYLV